MKKKILTDRVISKKTVFNNDNNSFEENDIDMLENAWNSMPDDVTDEEREMFVEIMERTLKLYHKCKKMYSYEESKNKN
jgi:hypothetical protein